MNTATHTPTAQEAIMVTTTTTTVRTECDDCHGPLAQAFGTTTNYVRCRRCGHVFPTVRED